MSGQLQSMRLQGNGKRPQTFLRSPGGTNVGVSLADGSHLQDDAHRPQILEQVLHPPLPHVHGLDPFDMAESGLQRDGRIVHGSFNQLAGGDGRCQLPAGDLIDAVVKH